jgi:hypothetical protein
VTTSYLLLDNPFLFGLELDSHNSTLCRRDTSFNSIISRWPFFRPFRRVGKARAFGRAWVYANEDGESQNGGIGAKNACFAMRG